MVTILKRFQHHTKVCTFNLFAIDLLAIHRVYYRVVAGQITVLRRAVPSCHQRGSLNCAQLKTFNTQKQELIITIRFQGTVLGK